MVDFREAELPLRRVALFSSGVGFFERVGTVEGSVKVPLPFLAEDVDDALKSLTIVDPASTAPSVSYPAEDTLWATLGSLKPDLSGNPGLAGLLTAVRGAEVEVTSTSGTLTGRVLSVEERWDAEAERFETYLSLYSAGQVQIIPARTLVSYRFLDQAITADLDRAMGVLLGAATNKLRTLEVRLPAEESREVALSYVTAAPVWKAAYRLDLSTDPFLQAWAIIDNASDTDWRDVELSLFVGRLTSFVQPLYQPYHLQREVVPLAIAGSAAAKVYGAGFAAEEAAVMADAQMMPVPMPASAAFSERDRGVSRSMKMRGPGAPVVTATGKPAGEQFTFTFPQAVTLNRHQSAMLPLHQGDFAARPLSILSGQSVRPGSDVNPGLGVEVTNNTGVPLPAGPVTVFDDGLYAGDALLDFLPADEKRLISYGDDLSVRASQQVSHAQQVIKASVACGLLRVNVATHWRTEYRLVNSGSKARRVLVEHPHEDDEILVEPAQADSLAAGLYRFEVDLPAGTARTFAVEVKRVKWEENSVVNSPASVVKVWSDRGLPAKAQAVLAQAAELSARQQRAEAELANLEAAEQKLVDGQARVRANLTAVGADTRSGAGYQQRLEDLETRLADVAAQQQSVRAEAESAAAELADFIATQDFEEDA